MKMCSKLVAAMFFGTRPVKNLRAIFTAPRNDAEFLRFRTVLRIIRSDQ